MEFYDRVYPTLALQLYGGRVVRVEPKRKSRLMSGKASSGCYEFLACQRSLGLQQEGICFAMLGALPEAFLIHMAHLQAV